MGNENSADTNIVKEIVRISRWLVDRDHADPRKKMAIFDMTITMASYHDTLYANEVLDALKSLPQED